MKHSKCDFFKSEIHYLGHLISADGISPLPDKLDTIKNMPAPKDVIEIKQFLGLTGYYRKFIPRFADISRPLTQLTKKEMKFMWTMECQKSFELLKSFLCGEPILKYADTSKPYTFTQMQVSTDGQESLHNHIQQSLMVSLLLLIIQLRLSVACSEAANSAGLH